jgi:hypothetical protein
MKPEDSISLDQLDPIRNHALKALKVAGALGCFPTPVSDVMAAARLTLSNEDVLNDGFLARIRKKVSDAGGALKRALTKVWGVIDVTARLVYIDKSVLVVKQTFLKLHEVAHAILPWQQKIYAVVEDCEKTLAPEISEQFDREANAFASEVLFQLDAFTHEAADHPVGLKTPLNLSKRYGASLYSTIRRYVSTNHRSCAVLVLDPPELKTGDGFVCNLRRVIASPSFESLVGHVEWAETVTPDDAIGEFVPIGRKMSRPRSLRIMNADNVAFDCVAEAFTQTYHVFILIHSVGAAARVVGF